MAVVDITSKDQFNELVNQPKLLVVHFFAGWAAQCAQMNDVMEELSKLSDFKDVIFAKILAEEISDVSISYNITAVPTFVFISGGKEVDRLNGANTAELKKKIFSCKSSKVPVVSTQVPKEATKGQSLKELVNAAPVMLFMKGTSAEPRCKFSRAIVDLLNSMNVKYKTFDILNNEEVRQGLKEYSNWPTYPQLYINGEFVGGLDIVKELKESGELDQMLPKVLSLSERLKALVNKAPVMVFMKGNPNQPRCGFSRTLMEILKETGVPFETFDILEDEEVRQGLKEYSNWPTYPQIYVKGELIGGLDIVKELKDSGELLDTLKV